MLVFQYTLFPNQKHITATFFDGKGESIFLSFPTGHTAIIDGGVLTETQEKISKILPFWNRHIDILFLTHSDRDHLEGFLPLLEKYSIGKIVLTGHHHSSPIFTTFLTSAQKKNIPFLFAKKNTNIRIGQAKFDILFPETNILGEKHSSNNNTSLVIRLYTSSTSLLLTGDIERKTEHILLSSSSKLFSEHLKVAHHGSKTSSSPEFIHAVSPKTAIIVAHKENPFSHPHTETLQTLSPLSPIVTKNNGDFSLSLSL